MRHTARCTVRSAAYRLATLRLVALLAARGLAYYPTLTFTAL